MRLINVKSRKLEDHACGTQKYAILSHTWGEGEITFDDIQSQSNQNKAGWHKIDISCKQAESDGYGYLWCDTCCIDKSSSAELSESINSMFRWYQEAEVCYAFLEDFHSMERLADARWFTRGWTLQELIAPNRLTFYKPNDSGWCKIGTREDLVVAISDITEIDKKALHGADRLNYVRGASFAKRIAWAANRVTTRDEDIAYCLMGLLDVNMPLLYGEGGIKAFGRLQEEYLRINLDQSFLVWLLRSDDQKLLACHPRDFQGCNQVSLVSDDVAPFSLNNKGLQIRLPVFQNQSVDATRSPEYFAILACCLGDRTEERIVIPLCAVEKSAKTFTFLSRSNYRPKDRPISTDEFDAARLRDCFILRSYKYSTTQMLSINVSSVLLFLWRPEFYSLDTSTPTCLSKPVASETTRIRMPDQPKQASYGVLFHCPFPCTDTRGNDDKNIQGLKILVRIDVGFEARYNVNVSIVTGNSFRMSQSDVPTIPSAEISSKSRSQIVTTPTKHSETLHASASWKRVSNQNTLSLDIELIAADNRHAHGLYARSVSALEALLTKDPLVHGVYIAIATSFLFPYSPFSVVILLVTVPSLYYMAFGAKQFGRYIRPEYPNAYSHFPIVLSVLLFSQTHFDRYNDEPDARFWAAAFWLLAGWFAFIMQMDIIKYRGYISEHKVAEKLDPKVGLESLLLDD